MQSILNELREILEYDDREEPNWHGYIGHFNVDGEAVVIYRSWADPREGCNSEKMVIGLREKGGVALSGRDEKGRPISQHHPQVDMQTALSRILAGARAGHRSAAEFAADVDEQ